MKKKRSVCLVIILVIALLAAGIIAGLRMLEQQRLRDAADIRCPTFDTQTYIAGCELADRDLAALLSKGLDAVDQIRYGSWLQNVRFTELKADSFPVPYAVLLKTAQDEQPVFCFFMSGVRCRAGR